MAYGRKYKPHKKAVKTLKKRTGIESFKELGLYGRKKKKRKPSTKSMLSRSIGLGYM